METSARSLVKRFYYEVWNNADKTIAREILHPDFQFRASLGPETHGLDDFLDYMRSIHTALARYECIIEDLIESDCSGGCQNAVQRGPPRLVLWRISNRSRDCLDRCSIFHDRPRADHEALGSW